MLTSHTVLFLMALLLVAALVEPLAKKIHLPFSIILVVIGFIGSEIAVKQLGIDTGIRWDNFGTIIFYFILPILIFQAALEIDIKLLWEKYYSHRITGITTDAGISYGDCSLCLLWN